MNEKKIEKDIQFQQVVNTDSTIAFELLKESNKREDRYRCLSIILSLIVSLGIICGTYLLVNFEVVRTETTKTIETGGDYNEYNDNSNDNRNINNNYGGSE